jgi:hypothetical protein
MVSTVWRPRLILAAAALTAAALTVGGCGSASTSNPAPSTSKPVGIDAPGGTISTPSSPAAAAVKKWDSKKENACALLTEDAVTAALGSDPGPGTFHDHFTGADFQPPPGGTDSGGCIYGSGATTALIRIIRFAEKPPAEAFKCEPKCTKIAGMGDVGYVAGGPTGPMYVTMAEGPLFLQTVIISTREIQKEDLITLGKNIAARF